MRFLQPGLTPADGGRSEKASPASALPIAVPAGSTEAIPEQAPAERTDGLPRVPEGLRIVLERIDALTSRLSACEDAIRRMEQNELAETERHEAARRDLEERLRRQLTNIAGATEQRQKAFAVKQAKLLELLASELSKVRSIAESARPQAAGPTVARSETQANQRRTVESGPDLDFFDMDGDASGGRAHDTAQRHDRTREDFEFWDWLESLPPEAAPKQPDDLIDLDENDLR